MDVLGLRTRQPTLTRTEDPLYLELDDDPHDRLARAWERIAARIAEGVLRHADLEPDEDHARRVQREARECRQAAMREQFAHDLAYKAAERRRLAAPPGRVAPGGWY
jgi:hypothetical protein